MGGGSRNSVSRFCLRSFAHRLGLRLHPYDQAEAERDRWTSHNPSISTFDISQSGTLTGITGMARRWGWISSFTAAWSSSMTGPEIRRTAQRHRRRGRRFSPGTSADREYSVFVDPDFSDAPVGRASVEYDPLFSVHSGKPRFLPAGRAGLRIRRLSLFRWPLRLQRAELAALFLAQHRSGQRNPRQRFWPAANCRATMTASALAR